MQIRMDKLIPPALLLLAPGIKAHKKIEPKQISDIVLRQRIRSIRTSIMSHLCALMTMIIFTKNVNSWISVS